VAAAVLARPSVERREPSRENAVRSALKTVASLEL